LYSQNVKDKLSFKY